MMDYYADTAAYSKSCINKDKPKMHCNGKCQMMKKLQQEEKKEQQEPVKKFDNKIEVYSNYSYSYNPEAGYRMITVKAFSSEKNYPVKDISYAFFHPPRV